ncbi:MAG TPA: hypothetical protein VMU50_06775 [Polyangia bacterium]|nr:hypothetical protein [Polyangia bacterium]
MRLGTCVLIELGLAGALLAGTGVVGVRGARQLHQAIIAARHPAMLASRTAAPAPLAARRDLSDVPDLRVALESSGTFMGMSDDLLLERVRTQPIVRFKLNHGGSSLSFRVDFADGSRAAFKPAQTNEQTIPRKEVAAYRLNRLLGLNAVPPAAPRAVSRDELLAHLHPDSEPALPRIQAQTIFGPTGKTLGEASYWIPVIKDSGFDTPAGRQQMTAWLSADEPIPVEDRAIAAQLSDLVVFDFLTANPDRFSGGNMKASPDGSQLYFMDNTMSFFIEPEGNVKTRLVLEKTQRFSRALYEALDRVTVATLHRILSEENGAPYEILTSAEINSVVARRDVVRRHIDGLIAELGPRTVLVFP